MEQDILYLLGLGAAAGATAGEIVKDVIADEAKNAIKAKILPRIYNKLDSELHFQFSKNVDVVEELFGHPKNFQLIGGHHHEDFTAITPDDEYSVSKFANFYQKNETEEISKTYEIQTNQPMMCFGGPKSNKHTRTMLGYGGESLYLEVEKDYGIRFHSLNNIANYKPIQLRRFLPPAEEGQKGLLYSEYAWIWRDKKGEYADFEIFGVDKEFQDYDFLKITKFQKHVVVDGLLGLGTRAIEQLMKNRRLIQKTIGELAQKTKVMPQYASYEAIFKVKVKHNEKKKLSEVSDLDLVVAEPFTPI